MAQTREIRFDNDLHGTRTFARAKWQQANLALEQWEISAKVMMRVARDLCGLDDCTCGVLRGEQADGYATEAWEAYQAWQAGSGEIGVCGRVIVRSL